MVSVVECDQAALAEALSMEVQCEQATLVALACAQPALAGAVRLQVPASRELTSPGPAWVGTAVAGVGTAVAGLGAAIAGAGVEAGAVGVGAQPR